VKEPVEDLLSADLALVGGVVSVGLQGGAELDGRDEEGAGLADRFEMAVQFDGASAVAVAEHVSVGFGAEFAHLVALVAGGQDRWPSCGVEGFDLLGATRGRTA